MVEHAGPPPQKSNTLLYCLVFGCGLLLLGGIGTAIALVFLARKGVEMAAEYVPTADPIQVQSRLDGILPSKIPAGYEGVSMRLPGGYDFVLVAPTGQLAQNQGGGDPELPLMMVVCKFPPGQQTEEVKKEIRRVIAEQRQNPTQLEVESPDGTVKQEIKIRGDSVGLEQTIGNTEDGKRIKQVFLAIPRARGSDEVVFLMAMGEESAFDEAAFKAYVDSIR